MINKSRQKSQNEESLQTNKVFNQNNESVSNTHIVSGNHSNLFADKDSIDKKERSMEPSTGKVDGIKQLFAENTSKATSNRRNDDFIDYVVGGDNLLPKRVRSKKSDLPYSSKSFDSPLASPSGGVKKDNNNILDDLKA